MLGKGKGKDAAHEMITVQEAAEDATVVVNLEGKPFTQHI